MIATDFGCFLLRLALVTALLGTTACDLQADSSEKSIRKVQTEYIELHDEVRRVLPKGTVIYYGRLKRDHFTREDHWYIDRLDVQSGNIHTLIRGNEIGFSQLLPRSLTQDGKLLLASARNTQSDKNVLLEINTHTGTFRIVADDIFSGDYSPSESEIVVYYPLNPKLFYHTNENNLRVGIIDKSGNFLKKIQCDSSRCLHATWTDENNNILFIDETTPETLKLYNLETENSITLFAEKNQNYKLLYPKYCNNNILVVRKDRAPNRDATQKSELVFLRPFNFNQSVSAIDFRQYLNYACIPGANNYIIAVHKGEKRNNLTIDLLYLSLVELTTGKKYRLTPGPSLDTLTLSPVLFTP